MSPRSPLLIAILGPAGVALAQPGATFQGLGGIDGSRAEGISADGLVVVGTLLGPTPAAFRWTDTTGTEPIGSLPGATSTSAHAANASGNVIVGVAFDSNGSRAFLWTPSAGMCEIPEVPGSMPGSFGVSAQAVSHNGRVIAGASGLFPARWSITRKGILLGPPTPPSWGFAFGISGDGQFIVGGSAWTGHAFRWSAAFGSQDLGTLPFAFESIAYAANLDGTVIVGESDQRAFRWTKAGSMHAIGGPGFSAAYAVNASGSVVVGKRLDMQTPQAMLWSPALGTVTIESLLKGFGVMPEGWQLAVATGISADGRTIVGVGTHDLDSGPITEGWIVTLPNTP
ncbi:MAG: hypothetical protein ACKVW3_00115 [Phycisphaerales bacterium]